MLTANGFELGLGFLVLIVCASFKTYAEREKPALSFVPDERQSFWHHAVQPDGRTLTQLSLRYQVTNFSKSNVMLSSVWLYRPWVRRDRVSYEVHLTTVGVQVMPNSLTYGAVTVMIKQAVGRTGKPMRVVIGLQDHGASGAKSSFRASKVPDPNPLRAGAWETERIVAVQGAARVNSSETMMAQGCAPRAAHRSQDR